MNDFVVAAIHFIVDEELCSEEDIKKIENRKKDKKLSEILIKFFIFFFKWKDKSVIIVPVCFLDKKRNCRSKIVLIRKVR